MSNSFSSQSYSHAKFVPILEQSATKGLSVPVIVFFSLRARRESLLGDFKKCEGGEIRKYGEKISHFNEKIRKVRRDFLKFSPAGNHEKNYG